MYQNRKMVRLTRHAAYEIRYHFVWVPKYRRNVLVGDIAVGIDMGLKSLLALSDGILIDNPRWL